MTISAAPGAHCLSPSRASKGSDGAPSAARYARMLPELPALHADEAMLHALGRAGGVCDCGDVEDTPSSLGGTAAGWPLFGQFVAHDITADRSALQSHVDPRALRNARSPQVNLECLYGDGPVGHPFLYQRRDPAKLLLGERELDVPRNAEGIAIIGDPRNDSHLIVAQLHLALLKVHNGFVDQARGRGVRDQDVFAVAARETRWHYQWTILSGFLPSLVGRSLVDEVLSEGPRWFRPSRDVFIPLEFADAAYRYGHAQIRQTYRLNGRTAPLALFPDLLGMKPVPPERAIDWTLFFDPRGTLTAQRARKIDGRLVTCLIHLPAAIVGATELDDYRSLAVRDLQRGMGVGLPSGEAVARHFGVKPLTPDELGLAAVGWSDETPLWYYILRESAIMTDGERLGPVGGRIVAEVLVTLLDRDPSSVRSAGREFEPQGSWAELLRRWAPGPAA
jgi:Animal haem peroxidase